VYCEVFNLFNKFKFKVLEKVDHVEYCRNDTLERFSVFCLALYNKKSTPLFFIHVLILQKILTERIIVKSSNSVNLHIFFDQIVDYFVEVWIIT